MQRWHRRLRNESVLDGPVSNNRGGTLGEALPADYCDLAAMRGFSEHSLDDTQNHGLAIR